MADLKFEGWIAFDKETGVGGMKWQEFEPKVFEETDVDIKITHCGMVFRVTTLQREISDAFFLKVFVVPMFTLLEAACFQQTILAVLAMSTRFSDCHTPLTFTYTWQDCWYYQPRWLQSCWRSQGWNDRGSGLPNWLLVTTFNQF